MSDNQQSLNVAQLSKETNALMEQAYSALIANYQRRTISPVMRNASLSGTLRSGSVRAARYANSQSQEYGSARANLKGVSLKEKTVLVEIKKRLEIVEEFEQFDQRTMPAFFNEVITGRNTSHSDTMARDREEDFFLTGRNAGTRVSVAGTTPDHQFENLVLNLTTLENQFFKGIDRSMIYMVMDDAAYSAFRISINRDMQNANVNSAAENFIEHNGVRVYPTPYLPSNVNRMVMARGAIAMPQLILPYTVAIDPYSYATILKTAYAITATAVMPDTIFWTEV
ncbi:MAG: hypothetical protein FWG63_03705 [Defluviitaleaceae bacterium]|nr:hypothetical protein [Defluviitaleaceae bacterium]